MYAGLYTSLVSCNNQLLNTHNIKDSTPYHDVLYYVHTVIPTDSSLALSQKCSFRLLSSQLLPMCVGLAERALTLWHREKLITATIAGATSSSSASSEVEGYMEELISVRYGTVHIIIYTGVLYTTKMAAYNNILHSQFESNLSVFVYI